MTMPHEHIDETGNKAGKDNGRKAVQTCLQYFELICTKMFLYSFNNVCIDGVIQQ